MSNASSDRRESDHPIALYKRLLKEYIDRRPSGTRQRIAEALGTHKSFISQITNPNYSVPLPGQHVAGIMRICHFSREEQDAFLDAYRKAHPNQAQLIDADQHAERHVLHIEMPHFRDPRRQREVMDTIRDVAARIISLAQQEEKD